MEKGSIGMENRIPKHAPLINAIILQMCVVATWPDALIF